VSDFYIDLWSYLSAYFNDTRWLEVHANGMSQRDRLKHLDATFNALKRDSIDGTMFEQVSQDYLALQQLIKEYGRNDQSTATDWLRRAEKMHVYSQELGLCYAELAANESAYGKVNT
jgi:hypothetical protein